MGMKKLATSIMALVIVTSERRAESLQSTPLSVVALGPEQLQSMAISSIEDMQAFVPNLTIIGGDGAGNTAPNFVVRGLGSSRSNAITGDRSVGLYIDDVYFPRANGSLLRVLDVEQIEVLRGPQGTLFGKNNTGGAIRYLTKKPDLDEFSGEVRVAAGEDSILEVQGVVNIPVSETFGMRLQYANLEQDGWIRRGDEILGTSDDQVARAAFRYDGDGKLTVDAGVTYVNAESNGYNLDLVAYDAEPGGFTGFSSNNALNRGFIAAGEEGLVRNDSRILVDDFTLPAICLTDGDGDIFTDTRESFAVDFGNNYGVRQSSNGCSLPQDTETITGSLNISYDLNDSMALRLISGYASVDYDGSIAFFPSGTISNKGSITSDSFSQEIQLSGSQFDGSLNWIVGGLYSEDDAFQDFVFTIAFPFGPLEAPPRGLIGRSFDLQTTSVGLFGEGTFAINEKFSVTAGLRYSEDEKEFIYRRHNHFQGNPLAGDESWDSLDYRLSLEYQATDDVMFYVTNSTAYRSGGFNDGANNALDLNGNGIADPGESNGGILPYDPEAVDSLEIGTRTEWGNSLRFNATLFSMSYDDIQVSSNDDTQTPPVPTIVNVGSADIRGVESELMWLMNKYLTLNAAIGYTDVKLGTFVDFDGSLLPAAALPGATELSYSVGLTFENTFSNESQLVASVNYGFTDEMGIDLDPANNYVVEDYALLNARIDYTLPGDSWTFSLLCNNCTDEVYANGAAAFPGDFFGGTVEYRGAPRRIQAQAKFEF